MAPLNTPPTPATQRLFFALWPDAQVRAQLAAHVDQWAWPPGAQRYAPADWHVTLHFMGQLDAQRAERVAELAHAPFAPCTLVLDQATLWPQGLAVVCASAVPAALQMLHAQLGAVLRGLDLSVDARPYQPHATLARRAVGATPPLHPPVVWPVHSFALVESTGNPAARYRVLRHYGAT